MKSTFITTVFNEERSIEAFIKSLINQSVVPDEIIITDANSSDKTISIIEKLLKNSKYKNRFIILSKKGNRSKGRNEAIKNAMNEIILCSDAGCVLDINWIKNILKPFKDQDIDVVSGFYLAKTENIFERSLSTYTCVMPEKIDKDNFLPSSRSIAFKKSSWKRAGGYPEWLDTCEDLVFDKNLLNTKAKFIFAKDAIVYWPQRKNYLEAFKQFFSYAIGDGTARYIRKSTPLLFIRYLVGILFLLFYIYLGSNILLLIILLLFLGYILWSIRKNYKYVGNLQAIIYLPILQFTSDIAVILGMSLGLSKSFIVEKSST